MLPNFANLCRYLPDSVVRKRKEASHDASCGHSIRPHLRERAHSSA